MTDLQEGAFRLSADDVQTPPPSETQTREQEQPIAPPNVPLGTEAAPEAAALLPSEADAMPPPERPAELPRFIRGGAITPKTMGAMGMRPQSPRGQAAPFNNIRGAAAIMVALLPFGILLAPAVALCFNLYAAMGSGLGFIFFGMDEMVMYHLMRTVYYAGLGVALMGCIHAAAAGVFYHSAALNLEVFGVNRRNFPPCSAAFLSVLPVVNFFMLYPIQRELLMVNTYPEEKTAKKSLLNLCWFCSWAFVPLGAAAAFSLYRDAVAITNTTVKLLPYLTPGTVFLALLTVVFGLTALVLHIMIPLLIAARQHQLFGQSVEYSQST